MVCRVNPLLAIVAIFGFLSGCTPYQKPERPAWRKAADNACIAEKRVQASAYIQPFHEMDGPGICGSTQPFKVSALQGGAVSFNGTQTLDCPMIAELDSWLADVVQPAARTRFGIEVAEISSMGSYSCRGMNNQRGASLSEHSFANALDIGGFSLADGRKITVVRDWTRGDEQTQAFLRDVQAGACEHFTTVLAPGSNAFHYNHIHVDLAMHGNSSRGLRRICKPAPMQMAPAPRKDDLPDAPEIEEDTDMASAAPRQSNIYAMHNAPASALPPEPITRPMGLASAPRLQVPRESAPKEKAHMRDDGAFVPEGDLADFDVTSSVRKR